MKTTLNRIISALLIAILASANISQTGLAARSSDFTPPSLCPNAGAVPVSTLFSDDMEGGNGNWTFVSPDAVPPFDPPHPERFWEITAPGSAYYHSSTHSLFGPDLGFQYDSYAEMSTDIYLTTEASPFLYFYHRFYFEPPSLLAYDGGVVEYSIDQGVSWQDARPFFSAGQDYNYKIDYTGGSLAGHWVFSADSGGMVASRYDLSSLVGQSVRFRWHINTDGSEGEGGIGWWVDDVRIYTCYTPTLDTSTSWYGSISITSDQPMVAVGRPHVGAQVMTYNGFAAGSLTTYVPMLFKNAYGSYDSALYIQNVDATHSANIEIKFYDGSGNLNCTKTDTIASLASKGYWVPSEDCLPASWVGGVVVTSDQNIVAVGRPHIGSQVTTYDGFAAGSLTTYVPMLFKNAYGSYDSALYIQNVDPTHSANIEIKFYDGSGNLNCTKTDTIASLASKGYWVPSEDCLPASWVGGVVVTSDQNIVAVGRPHIGSRVTTYDGFAAGSLTTYVPMLFKNAYGSYDSALYIQNVDPTHSANIEIKFYDGSGNLNCTKTDTIASLASKGYWVPSEDCLPASWVGGVVVTSDQNIVAVGRPHIGSEVATYDGFTIGSLNSYVPMLFKNMWGSYDSAFYVQNVDSANTAHITIKFYDVNGVLSCVRNDTIPTYATLGYWVPSVTCLP